MAVETVEAQTTESAPVEFDYDFGDNLNDAISKFGEDVCFAYLRRSLIVAAQGAARTLIKSGKGADEIVAKMAEWTPGMPRQAKSKEEKLRELLAGLDPEARKRLAAELKTPKAA